MTDASLQDSPAIRLGLVRLSPRERELFDILHARPYPGWMDTRALAAHFVYSNGGIRLLIGRLRHRLRDTGWSLDNGRMAVRLLWLNEPILRRLDGT